MTEQENSSYYGYELKIHELAEKYLNQEVLKCDTMLVKNLMKQSHDDLSYLMSEFSIDKIENYFDTSIEAIEDFLTCKCDNMHWCDLDFHEREQLAYDLGFEPQPHEIYEWWAVTSWLADELTGFDQPVLSNDFGHWWGRTCTGQAIILDGILQKIAESNF
jgi:hypothetical protein